MLPDHPILGHTSVGYRLSKSRCVQRNFIIHFRTGIVDVVARHSDRSRVHAFNEIAVRIEQIKRSRIVVANERVVAGNKHRRKAEELRQIVSHIRAQDRGSRLTRTKRPIGCRDGFVNATTVKCRVDTWSRGAVFSQTFKTFRSGFTDIEEVVRPVCRAKNHWS